MLLSGCAGPSGDADDDDASDGPTDARPAFWFYPHNGTAIVDDATALTVHPTGGIGGEPTIGVTSDGILYVAAGDDVLRSVDEAATWETVFHYDAPLLERTNADDSDDPLLWVDHLDRVWVNHLWRTLCTFEAHSDDGTMWTEPRRACFGPGIDHQKFASVPPGPVVPDGAAAVLERVLHLCYSTANAQNALWCTSSYDEGVTWSPAVVVQDAVRHGCNFLGGRMAAAPDGTFVSVRSAFCPAPAVSITRDSGITWQTEVLSGAEGARSIVPGVGFAPDGRLLVAWRSNDDTVRLSWADAPYSDWATPLNITPPGVGSTAFVDMAVHDDGRFVLAFLGTAATGRPNDVPADARWYPWIMEGRADELGAEVRLWAGQATVEDEPFQIGPVCVLDFGGCHDAPRNLLDFIGAAKAPDGSTYVSFTDGCLEECVDAATSLEREVVVVRHRPDV